MDDLFPLGGFLFDHGAKFGRGNDRHGFRADFQQTLLNFRLRQNFGNFLVQLLNHAFRGIGRGEKAVPGGCVKAAESGFVQRGQMRGRQ